MHNALEGFRLERAWCFERRTTSCELLRLQVDLAGLAGEAERRQLQDREAGARRAAARRAVEGRDVREGAEANLALIGDELDLVGGEIRREVRRHVIPVVAHEA